MSREFIRPRNLARSGALTGRSVELPRNGVPDGKVRCPVCDGTGKPSPSGGKIRAHKTPRGEGCPNRMLAVDLAGIELPPVVLPQPRLRTSRAPKRPDGEPSRLDVGSNCRECGKWLPGERSLCGACYAKGAKR